VLPVRHPLFFIDIGAGPGWTGVAVYLGKSVSRNPMGDEGSRRGRSDILRAGIDNLTKKDTVERTYVRGISPPDGLLGGLMEANLREGTSGEKRSGGNGRMIRTLLAPPPTPDEPRKSAAGPIWHGR